MRIYLAEAIARLPEFRGFVFTAFNMRVTDLFRLIEDVVFSRLDIRLAERLLTLAGAGDDSRSISSSWPPNRGRRARASAGCSTNSSVGAGFSIHRGGLVLTGKAAIAELASQA